MSLASLSNRLYGSPTPAPETRVLGAKLRQRPDSRLPLYCSVAALLHAGLLVGLVILYLLFKLLGWAIPLFEPLTMSPRDIEFVLVDNPTAPPRDPNTRNRADRATRAGGQKRPNQPEAETQRIAGTPSQAQQAVRTQRPRPKSSPQPKPQPSRQPSRPKPPAPKAPKAVSPPKAPKPTAKPVPVAPTSRPSPVPPAIRTPAIPAPTAPNTGPVYKRPSNNNSTSGSATGTPKPSRLPSGPSSSPVTPSVGRPASQGSSGAGGRSSFNQNGSPGGGGGPAGIDALPEPDFGPYIAELQRRIKRNWNPPADNRNKRVVAVFTISRDGRLVGVRLNKSSGVAVADQAAVNAIHSSAPFRPLPPNFRGQTIDVLFTFDYNVFSGNGGGVRLN